jgi:CspA family cold shock protein
MSSDDLGPKVSGAGYLSPDLVGDLADETASVIELTGAIKWFDVSKGYGFIIPDNGCRTSAARSRRDGYQTVAAPKGLQAFRILSMDDRLSFRRRTHVQVTPTLERNNRLRALLTRGDGTPDIFGTWRRCAATD